MAISDLPPAPTLSLVEQPATTSSRIPDFIDKYLPAKQVHLFSGASGAGKTALTFGLLSCIETGKPFFNIGTVRKPAFTGYLAADRSWEDHKIWLETVNLSDLPYYSLIDDLGTNGKIIRDRRNGDRFDLFKRCIASMLIRQKLAPTVSLTGSLTERLKVVDECLNYLPKDSFLVVDPVSLFLGGDLLKYDTVYSHMLDLNQFCIKYQCTILGIAHAGKQKADPGQRYARAQDRIVGTTAQTGCAGTTMHLAPSSEVGKDWAEFTMIPHHAPEKMLKMVRDNRGLFIEYDEVQPTTQEANTQEKLESLANRIIPFFPADFSDIHVTKLTTAVKEGLNIGRSMLYKYLDVLEAQKYVTSGKAPGTWRLTRKN